MLELRPPDLPGLHDADAGRHALPGVLEAEDEGPHRRDADVGTPQLTYVLIAINVAVFVASAAAAGR